MSPASLKMFMVALINGGTRFSLERDEEGKGIEKRTKR